MGQALYRKYRPKKLAEVVGQEHITTTLKHAVESGRISHAYLFVGPHGVGKTSVARIMAHEINSLPYTEDNTHFDIIEIDAASNRRIDEIRDLREKVHIAPISAKYKVYIIDEVHMLTKEAFNALLKTLEEPPQHVIFILATTEAYKLPETIVSRTQRFTFRPIKQQQLVEHLRDIAKEENIKVSDEALELIAQHGNGSFRDSISLLDQAGNQADAVSALAIENLLGIAPQQAIENLFNSLSETPQPSEIMNQLGGLYAHGYEASILARQLAERLRAELISPTVPTIPKRQILTLLRRLLEVPVSYNPDRLMEVILLETLAENVSEPTDSPGTTIKAASEKTGLEKNNEQPKPPSSAGSRAQKSKTNNLSANDPAKQLTKKSQIDINVWSEVLEALKKKHNTVYGIVRNAQVTFPEPDVVALSFAFAFHQKRIADAKNTKILTDIIQSLTGKNIELICTHDKSSSPTPLIEPVDEPTVATPVDGTLSAISSIFGGAELLES